MISKVSGPYGRAILVGLTVALTATATSVAPVLDRVMEDKISPSVAEAATRACSVPPMAGRLAVGPKTTPSLETSKPDGAVAAMLTVRLAPTTPMLCGAEAVPEKVENEEKVPVAAMEGRPAEGVTEAHVVATIILPKRSVGEAVLPP